MINKDALRALIREWFPDADSSDVEKLEELFITAITSWNQLGKEE